MFLKKPCLLLAGPDNLRRYEIAEVRRKGLQTGRSLPRGYLQADLDLVHPPGLLPPDKLLAEAELIKASTHHCCCSLPRLCSHMTSYLCAVVVRRLSRICRRMHHVQLPSGSLPLTPAPALAGLAYAKQWDR